MSPLFTGINELAIAVKDAEQAGAVYATALQAELDPMLTHLEEGIGIRQTGVWVGDFRIAFVEDASGTGPVQRFIDARGEGPYELCLRTSDLEAAIEQLTSAGMKLTSTTPRILREYRWKGEVYAEVRVVFLHPSTTHGLLIELQEWVK